MLTTHPGPSCPPETSAPQKIRVSEIIGALSYALDLTEGQPAGHSARTCLLGMRIAAEIGMPIDQQADLYYALLLKDAGCSSNASRLFHILSADEIRAKRNVKTTDWTRVGWESLRYAVGHVATGAPFLKRVRTLIQVAARQQVDSRELVKIRCERGASIANQIGFSPAVGHAILSLDEHWNGGGYPSGLAGSDIPIFSRIMNLAQTLDVFYINRGPHEAMKVVKQRAKRWFDPALVKATESLAARAILWQDLEKTDLLQQIVALEPERREMFITEASLDNLCNAFAEVIDAKSPFTYRHSNGVANAAISIASELGQSAKEITFIRRAALLHDIGKLSVPNSILEKPGKLDAAEWDVVKKHPYYTLQILQRIPTFGALSDIAAAHHEKLDGSGYFRNWGAEQLSVPARILVVADIYDALAARRPYREAMPPEQVFSIMRKDAPHALDSECLEALIGSGKRNCFAQDLANMADNVGAQPTVSITDPHEIVAGLARK